MGTTAVARTPKVFVSYSWDGPEHQEWVKALAARLRFSCDAETGLPLDFPPGVRVAYLKTDRHEGFIGDLIFRTRPLRKLASPHPPIAIVCPSEVTAPRPSNVTCTSCRLCHR